LELRKFFRHKYGQTAMAGTVQVADFDVDCGVAVAAAADGSTSSSALGDEGGKVEGGVEGGGEVVVEGGVEGGGECRLVIKEASLIDRQDLGNAEASAAVSEAIVSVHARAARVALRARGARRLARARRRDVHARGGAHTRVLEDILQPFVRRAPKRHR
jgi:hypothetical protein